MKTTYYYLVSGLPEINEESAANISRIKMEIEEQLDSYDAIAFRFLIFKNDNKNLLQFLRQRDGIEAEPGTDFFVPANFSFEDLENLIIDAYDSEYSVPEYIEQFLEELKNEKYTLRERENRLLQLYYEAGIEYPNRFISQYFLFKRDLKNIILTLNAKMANFKSERIVIGDYDLAKDLFIAQGRDLGLSKVYDYVNTLADKLLNRELVDLELEIDNIVFSFLNENFDENGFHLEAVLIWFLKLASFSRWNQLREQEGSTALDSIVNRIVQTSALPLENVNE
ncbi:MAG: DUF2764 family protein [Leptospiraceae bacterium]|nr:DUF2764 family protein [Leptospiraceae bacterium]